MAISTQLAKFFHSYPLVAFPTGAVITHPGSSSYVYFLQSGLVKQYGKCFISYHRPHSFFPLLGLVSSYPNQYYYSACQSSRLYRAPVKDFRLFIKSHPDVLYQISARLLLIIDHLNTRMQILAVGRSIERLAAFLIYVGQAYGKQSNGKTEIAISFTHREIADWIGLTRETVSWQMLRLKKQGLIQYSHRRISILDLPSLQQAVNFA